MNRHLLRSIVVVGLLAGSLVAANAGQVQVCSQLGPSRASGPSPIKARASGNTYTTNVRGCALVSFSDYPDFLAQGFVADPPVAIVNQMTAAKTVVLPAGASIQQIVIQETSGGAVTGGLDIGTTLAGTDVVSTFTCGANCLTTVTDTSLSKRVFSSTSPQTLFLQAHTNFNSGPAINVTIFYRTF